MCGPPAFVSLGAKGSQGPGRLQAGTQYACMREYLGLRRPRYAVWIGLAWSPTEAAKLLLLLDQLRPRAIAGLQPAPAIASLHFTGKPVKDGRRLLEPPPSASRGRRCLPRTPTQSSGGPSGLIPPLVVLAGLTFVGYTHRQFSCLAP